MPDDPVLRLRLGTLRGLLSPEPGRREVYEACYEVECQFRPAPGADGTARALSQMLRAERGEAE